MKLTINRKTLHIIIIVLGIIFINLCAFHTSLWFDESYSVAIAKHSFAEIWTITGHDVHPPLYYWVLHILYILFGNNVLIFRLFSVLGIAILGIIGYTHIRKDFGEGTGILFSLFTYFLPIMAVYAGEIRMYSWACLLVTLVAIYAYRFYKGIKENNEKNKTRNLVIFGIFSICCCYIHYYALITAFLINFVLLIFLIKNRKQDVKSFRNFIILGVIQVILYIPWLICLITQLNSVRNGFWITLDPINTPIETFSFQFRRELDSTSISNVSTIIPLMVSFCLYIYLGVKTYKYKKEKNEIKPAYLSLGIYWGVIGIMLLASLIIFQPVYFSRYLFVMTGLYIFWIAYLIAKEKKKIIIFIICTVLVIIGTISNIQNINLNYTPENTEMLEYLEENIQEGDILIYEEFGVGGVIASLFPEYEQYFLCDSTWDVEEAYKAYGPGMKIISKLEGNIIDWSFLDDYTGRIWIIDDADLYEKMPKENITVLKEGIRYVTTYHDYVFNAMLVEKK